MERKEIDTDKDTKMNKHRHTQKHLHADKKKRQTEQIQRECKTQDKIAERRPIPTDRPTNGGRQEQID